MRDFDFPPSEAAWAEERAHYRVLPLLGAVFLLGMLAGALLVTLEARPSPPLRADSGVQ
jgi:hypothetical protein